MTDTPLLNLRDLQVEIPLRHGRVRPLGGVDLTIGRSETIGIVGESGSGKTMTALSIMGLLPGGGHITGGQIIFDGEDLTKAPKSQVRRIRGTRIGMIFQDPLTSLNPTMKIGDQVGEPLRVHQQVTKTEARERTIELLRRVGMPRPDKIVDDYPHQLSGGMRQRAMIAMSLICSPSLLIADEPTTALDVTTQRQILDLIDDLKEEFQSSVMLVTHDLGVVAGRTDKVAVMYAGRVVEIGDTVEVFTNPQHQYTRSLMAALPEQASHHNQRLYSIPGSPPDLSTEIVGCPFAPRCPRADETCHSVQPRQAGEDHLVACHHPAGPPLDRGQSISHVSLSTLDQRPVIAEIRSLSKEYPALGGKIIRRRIGTVSAVNEVSFTVRAGETFGLVGESGCGKSTLGRVIAGLEPATDGELIVDGLNVTSLSGAQRKELHRSVQLMFQDSYAAMDPRMRVDEILTEPLDIQKVGTKEERTDTVENLLDQVGLSEQAMERYPHEFSGGQLQRIGLARSLALQPKLIVCDEPVSALDVSVQAQVLNLMRGLQAELDLALIFISHNLSVVRYMSDRIGVMYLGKLVEVGPADEVATAPRHPYTQALIDAVPIADPTLERKERVAITGELPSAINPPEGCRFKTRCPFAQEICDTPPPVVGDVHQVACHFPLGGEEKKC